MLPPFHTDILYYFRGIYKGLCGPFLGRAIKINPAQKYAIHLDELRRKKRLTVKQLCEDIVDTRTYRRYLSGDRTLTPQKIRLFCERLLISSTDFYYTSSEYDTYEFQQINNLYKLLTSHNYDQFYIDLRKINKSSIMDIQTLHFYEFCILKAEYELHKKRDDEVLYDLSNIIDYPNLLNKNAFDFVDLVTLLLIAEIEVKFKKQLALEKLKKILLEPHFIYTSSTVTKIIPSIYSNVSLFYLRLSEYSEANELSKKGIDYSLRFSDISGLAHLYYVNSYTSLQLGYSMEAEISAIKCIMTSNIKNDKYEIDMFTSVLKKDFNFDPILLVSKHIKKLKKDDE